MDVTDDAEVGDTEDRCFLVLVDRDDVLRALHAHHVLSGTGDARSDVHGRLDDLAGLADLVAVRHPSGVDDGSRRTRRTLEGLGERLDHRVLVGLAEATASSDHDGRFVELGTRGLLDVHRSHFGATGGSEIGNRGRHDLAGSAGAGFGDEALRAERCEVRTLAGEGRVDQLGTTEDRCLHRDRVAVDRDRGGVGEHGAVELDRQTRHHVAALVALREHDQVGAVAAVDHGLHRCGNGNARQCASEIAGRVDLGGPMISERACNGGAVTGDERRDVATEAAGLGEQFECAGGRGAVGGLCEHPDVVDTHQCLLR